MVRDAGDNRCSGSYPGTFAYLDIAADCITEPCMMTVLGPMDAYLEIIADGWTAVAYTNGYMFANCL